jgi:hypothetical protein
MNLRLESSQSVISHRPTLNVCRHSESIVELKPRRQPGRSDRKAAVYASEIARLRSAGYTYEAIREALADVGIDLSTSALRREMRRLRKRPTGVASVKEIESQPPSRPLASATPPPSLASAPRAAVLVGCSGQDIAEAFFNANPSNPLLRNEEIP